MSYKVVRKFFKGAKYTLHTGLTLEEAQELCRDPESSSETCQKSVNRRRTRVHGPWFNSYSEE